MLEQHRHLANNYEDIVNLQGVRHVVVALLTACFMTNLRCTKISFVN